MEKMKILQLFSNWKWTGPADPTVSLCKELERRGHDVMLAYRKPPLPVEDSLEKRILKEGVKATDRFGLNHSLKIYDPRFFPENLRDIRDIADYLRRERFDILNVHYSHGHLVGGIAARWSGNPVVIIRTDHKRDSIKPGLGNRLLISRFTDGILTFSEKGRREDAAHFNLPMERVGKVSPALNLERMDSRKISKDMRAVFGIRQDEIVIGMVARYQKYRRTKFFLEAVKEIAREFPNVKVLLVGRSSQMQESVVRPMKELGVEPWVKLAGYRTDDYFDTMACMDLFVFLMAGSDGTARALREAMAMGKPVIVADRGMLPELVDHGSAGLVVQDTPGGLAEAVLQLLRDPQKRAALGKAAWEKAHRDFRLDQQAADVEDFYLKMIQMGRRR